MKIAVLHNYMDNIGGAEKVALVLAENLKADLYTTNFSLGKIQKMGYSDVRIRTIGKIPLNAPLRQQLALIRFRKLKLDYDFYIVGGDWAMSAAVNNKPNLWYVHSPIREIWDLYSYTRQHNVPMLARPVFDAWVSYNRYLNRRYAKHVNQIACNSENTKKRIRKYLDKDAKVIYPPVETSRFHHSKEKGYWLSVNRLITHKRVDMQMRAFNQLKDEKLVIVGSYEQSTHFRKYAEYIKSIKPKNVRIVSWVSQETLVELYAHCKGFVTTSLDEDFGMTAVEAMASGKPVIAPDQGGYKETISSKTGVLIDNIDHNKLAKAVKSITDSGSYKEDCIRQAKKFDTAVFLKEIRKLTR